MVVLFCSWAWPGAGAASGAARSIVPASNLAMSQFSPRVITANGSSRASAVVRLSDLLGAPLPGDAGALQLSATDPRVGFDPVHDNGDGTYTVTVISSPTAHQVTVTVTDGNLTASQPLVQVHGPARRVGVSLASPVLTADSLSHTQATVTVADANGNPIPGDALVLGAGRAGVRFGAITDHGNGTYTATLTSSNTPGRVTIRATDISASPTAAGTASLDQTPAPSLVSMVTMEWTFAFTRTYTVASPLVVNGAPSGSAVQLGCRGQGCPLSALTLKSGRQPRCPRHPQHPCRSGSSLILTPLFAHRRLKPGAHLTVRIVRPGWIGKFYGFTVRSAAPPTIRISCTAPGATQPGGGC